jgi:hypothetical protein
MSVCVCNCTDGFTPLHAATASGNEEAVGILVEVGQADLWARDLQGRTSLHLAVKLGKHQLSEQLKGSCICGRYTAPHHTTSHQHLCFYFSQHDPFLNRVVTLVQGSWIVKVVRRLGRMRLWT